MLWSLRIEAASRKNTAIKVGKKIAWQFCNCRAMQESNTQQHSSQRTTELLAYNTDSSTVVAKSAHQAVGTLHSREASANCGK
jgi:hypothetical protein